MRASFRHLHNPSLEERRFEVHGGQVQVKGLLAGVTAYEMSALAYDCRIGPDLAHLVVRADSTRTRSFGFPARRVRSRYRACSSGRRRGTRGTTARGSGRSSSGCGCGSLLLLLSLFTTTIRSVDS